MELSTITPLLETYGWLPIESKNQYMVSFRKVTEDGDVMRMNIYHTGTVQVQVGAGYSGGRVVRDVDINALEDILIDYE